MDATLADGAACTSGEGVVFDGTDDYVDLVNQSLGGPMTIAVWARWDALNTYSQLFGFADALNDAAVDLMLGNEHSGAITYLMRTNGTWEAASGGASSSARGRTWLALSKARTRSSTKTVQPCRPIRLVGPA